MIGVAALPPTGPTNDTLYRRSAPVSVTATSTSMLRIDGGAPGAIATGVPVSPVTVTVAASAGAAANAVTATPRATVAQVFLTIPAPVPQIRVDAPCRPHYGAGARIFNGPEYPSSRQGPARPRSAISARAFSVFCRPAMPSLRLTGSTRSNWMSR